MSRPLALLACGLLLCLAPVLAGCGKKGDLRPPPGEAAAFIWPQEYPAPRTVVPDAPLQEEEPVLLPPSAGFRQPGALPSRDPSRTTTKIYRAQ